MCAAYQHLVHFGAAILLNLFSQNTLWDPHISFYTVQQDNGKALQAMCSASTETHLGRCLHVFVHCEMIPPHNPFLDIAVHAHNGVSQTV